MCDFKESQSLPACECAVCGIELVIEKYHQIFDEYGKALKLKDLLLEYHNLEVFEDSKVVQAICKHCFNQLIDILKTKEDRGDLSASVVPIGGADEGKELKKANLNMVESSEPLIDVALMIDDDSVESISENLPGKNVAFEKEIVLKPVEYKRFKQTEPVILEKQAHDDYLKDTDQYFKNLTKAEPKKNFQASAYNVGKKTASEATGIQKGIIPHHKSKAYQEYLKDPEQYFKKQAKIEPEKSLKPPVDNVSTKSESQTTGDEQGTIPHHRSKAYQEYLNNPYKYFKEAKIEFAKSLKRPAHNASTKSESQTTGGQQETIPHHRSKAYQEYLKDPEQYFKKQTKIEQEKSLKPPVDNVSTKSESQTTGGEQRTIPHHRSKAYQEYLNNPEQYFKKQAKIESAKSLKPPAHNASTKSESQTTGGRQETIPHHKSKAYQEYLKDPEQYFKKQAKIEPEKSLKPPVDTVSTKSESKTTGGEQRTIPHHRSKAYQEYLKDPEQYFKKQAKIEPEKSLKPPVDNVSTKSESQTTGGETIRSNLHLEVKSTGEKPNSRKRKRNIRLLR